MALRREAEYFNPEPIPLPTARAKNMVRIGDAFPVIFPKVASYVGRHMGDDGEDLAMDAFAKAIQAAALYQDRGSLKSWIFRIVERKVVNELIRRGRDPMFQHVGLDENLPIERDTDGYGDEEVRQKQRALLEEAKESLTQRQRQVLQLHLTGMSNADIAAKIESNPAAVKQILVRTTRSLKRILNPEALEERKRLQEDPDRVVKTKADYYSELGYARNNSVRPRIRSMALGILETNGAVELWQGTYSVTPEGWMAAVEEARNFLETSQLPAVIHSRGMRASYAKKRQQTKGIEAAN